MRHDEAGSLLANASAGALSRPGRERGGGDLVGRSRRARMSFGLGGIARRLIDLLTEDRQSDGRAEQKDDRDQPVSEPAATTSCPRLTSPFVGDAGGHTPAVAVEAGGG